MEPRINYKPYVKSVDRISKDMKKYTYHRDPCIYISSYEKKGKEYEIKIRNMNILTGNEYYDTFTIPSSNVKEIVSIN